MAACLHTYLGFRIPPATVEAVRKMIIETKLRDDIDVDALRARICADMIEHSPWPRIRREDAARHAAEAFLQEARAAGLARYGANAYGWRPWVRVFPSKQYRLRKTQMQEGAQC